MPKRLHHPLSLKTVASVNKPGSYAGRYGLTLNIDNRFNKLRIWRGTVDG